MVDVKIFSRKGVEKDERAKPIEDDEVVKMEKNLKDEIRILQDERDKRIEDLLDGTHGLADVTKRPGERVRQEGRPSSRASRCGA